MNDATDQRKKAAKPTRRKFTRARIKSRILLKTKPYKDRRELRTHGDK